MPLPASRPSSAYGCDLGHVEADAPGPVIQLELALRGLRRPSTEQRARATRAAADPGGEVGHVAAEVAERVVAHHVSVPSAAPVRERELERVRRRGAARAAARRARQAASKRRLNPTAGAGPQARQGGRAGQVPAGRLLDQHGEPGGGRGGGGLDLRVPAEREHERVHAAGGDQVAPVGEAPLSTPAARAAASRRPASGSAIATSSAVPAAAAILSAGIHPRSARRPQPTSPTLSGTIRRARLLRP